MNLRQVGQSLKEQCDVVNLEIEEFFFTAVSDSAIEGSQEHKYVTKEKRPLPRTHFAWGYHILESSRLDYPLSSLSRDTDFVFARVYWKLGRLVRNCAYERDKNADSLVPQPFALSCVTSGHPSKLEIFLQEAESGHHGSSSSFWKGDTCKGLRGLPRISQGFLQGAGQLHYPSMPIFTSSPIKWDEEHLSLHILPLFKSSLCRMYCGLRIYPNIKPYPFPLPWLFWIFVPKEFYLEFNGPLLYLFPRNVEHPYLLCPFPFFFFFHFFILPFNDLGLLLSSHSTSLETLV